MYVLSLIFDDESESPFVGVLCDNNEKACYFQTPAESVSFWKAHKKKFKADIENFRVMAIPVQGNKINSEWMKIVPKEGVNITTDIYESAQIIEEQSPKQKRKKRVKLEKFPM